MDRYILILCEGLPSMIYLFSFLKFTHRASYKVKMCLTLRENYDDYYCRMYSDI